jgi:predicted kinase
VITLPDPSLVVLIGPAGAGKSTFARRSFEPSEILASDGFRAIVAGDEADQSATRPAFGILHREVVRRLANRRLTVVDATNVERAARRALVRRAASASVPAIAIALDLPLEVCLARNAARGRVVPVDIVERHVFLLRRALGQAGGLVTEGFAASHVITSAAELDAVVIERGPPSGDAEIGVPRYSAEGDPRSSD